MKKFQKIFIFMILLSYINSTCMSKYKGISFLDITIPTIPNIPSDFNFEEYLKSKQSPKPNKADSDDNFDMIDFLEELEGNWIDDSASSGNCHDRQFSDWEKQFYVKCCYARGKCKIEVEEGKTIVSELEVCVPITNQTYNDIDNYIKDGKEQCDDYKFDCYSSYLKLVFLSFIIILLL